MLEIKKVPIDSIYEDPNNARKHSVKNISAIKGSIAKFGQVEPLLVKKDSRIIIGGNGRHFAMKEMGITEVDIVEIDLSSFDATALSLALNRTSELAEWDDQILSDTLQALDNIGFELDDIGFKDGDLDFLDDNQEKKGNIDDDEVPEVDQNPYGVQTADIWQLGNHRLMCGDSTKIEDVERLMDGQKADICFTSPPYNSGNGGYKTDYYGKTKNFYRLKNDNRSEEEWIQFCNNILENIGYIVSSDESPVVWNVMYNSNCRNGYGINMFAGCHQFKVKETICWDKKHGFPSASKGILSRNWELVFVLSKGKKYFSTQSDHEVRFNKWDIKSPKQNNDNKATFPVELAEKAIKDFSIVGHKMVDPFCGSGTTLIACEKTDRICFGMEIDPHYCSVIIKRWEEFTGKKAIKL